MAKKTKNYITVRRELWYLVQDGRLSIDEFLVVVVIYVRTNPHNGTCRTNCVDLAEEFKGRFTVNRINKMLLKLRRMGLIWYTKRRGKRGKFPIIPHCFIKASGEVTDVKKLITEDEVGRRFREEPRAEVRADLSPHRQTSRSLRRPGNSMEILELRSHFGRTTDNDNDKDND